METRQLRGASAQIILSEKHLVKLPRCSDSIKAPINLCEGASLLSFQGRHLRSLSAFLVLNLFYKKNFPQEKLANRVIREY